MQAVEQLEAMAGISSAKVSASSRHELLQQCVNIYSHYLWSEEGKSALEYLRRRGFDDYALQFHQVGYAPNGYSLRSFDIDSNQLRKEGLLKGKTEYFSTRIIFPIRNYQDQLVHLVGRYLGEVPKDDVGEDMLPRYKDTQGYQGLAGTKSYLAFEHLIPGYLKAGQRLIIAEGFPDTLSLVQRGSSAVGLLGLEKLASHAHKLKGFTEIITIFDNDIYPEDHPTHPLEYKSWRRVIPQLIDLQIILPHVNFYLWMVPEVSQNPDGSRYRAKDVNDWLAGSQLPFDLLQEEILSGKQELISALIKRWGSDLSQHSVLLRLLQATGRDASELKKYVSPELDPIDYALSIIGA